MAFNLVEALKLTQDPVKSGIYESFAKKDQLASFTVVDDSADVETLVYSWYVKEGLGGIKDREINGAIPERDGSKTQKYSAECKIYSTKQVIDRRIVANKDNVQVEGIMTRETKDLLDSLAVQNAFDRINASIAGGDKYDGAITLATKAGQVNDLANVALSGANVYDVFTAGSDACLGDTASKVAVMRRNVFRKLQKAIRAAGDEVITLDDKAGYGRSFYVIDGVTVVPLDSTTENAQGGAKTVVDFVPANTIVFMTMDEAHFHQIQPSTGDELRVTDLSSIRAGEQPVIDLEAPKAWVDKMNGLSIYVVSNIG